MYLLHVSHGNEHTRVTWPNIVTTFWSSKMIFKFYSKKSLRPPILPKLPLHLNENSSMESLLQKQLKAIEDAWRKNQRAKLQGLKIAWGIGSLDEWII